MKAKTAMENISRLRGGRGDSEDENVTTPR